MHLFFRLILSLLIIFNLIYPSFALDQKDGVKELKTRYPDYAKMYLGEDKFETFNRKMFNLNNNLNKFIARPIHILWASIMPQYGMDRIQGVYNNIEYPKRLASCIIQKDGEGIKNETLRFLTNTTIGLGGMFDPASKLLKKKQVTENMDQALCKCKMKSGSYMVMPVLNSCTPRSLCGRSLEAVLDPSVYLVSPLTALIKFGLVVNKTSYTQTLAEMLQTTFADPYDIQKKLYGIDGYIKNTNLDRKDLLLTDAEIVKDVDNSPIEEERVISSIDKKDQIEGQITGLATNVDNLEIIKKETLKPDIILDDFNAQTPIVDSMRTALFDDPNIYKSIWNELSLWNRSFQKRIKKSTVVVIPERDEYKFRYIMQKDKSSPVIILYPSIGEGYNTHHSTVFAKMFYDEGYSVIMLGSHFNWEFVKSMPEGYCPGIPLVDADNLRLVTRKIIDKLENKYESHFKEKYIIGTSFGAFSSLFVANQESKNNTLGVTKFIAISPPVELVYAVKKLDKNGEEFDKYSPEVKQKTAITAAKILQLLDKKEKDPNFTVNELPFSETEGKLITTFFIRQKLSDLIFTLENIPKGKKTDIYKNINNLSYRDYVEKYLLKGGKLEDVQVETSLYSLSDYLTNNDNYLVYHSMNDFFATQEQVSRLKTLAQKNLICLSDGSHLGFLYRKEFQEALKDAVLNKI